MHFDRVFFSHDVFKEKSDIIALYLTTKEFRLYTEQTIFENTLPCTIFFAKSKKIAFGETL